MKSIEFDLIVNEELNYCKQLLGTKAREYTPVDPEDVELIEEEDGQFVMGFAADDRLRHFKKAGVLMNCDAKEALFGMMAKHLVSVSDMCTSGDKYTVERWTEKVTDSINYMLLLLALVIEEEKHGQN